MDGTYYRKLQDERGMLEKLYRDRDWLYKKYITEELPISKIAKLCNASNNGIWYWLKKFNIKRRTLEQAQRLRALKKVGSNISYRDFEWLNQKYTIKKYSACKIAKICSVNYNTIWKWLDKFHIKMRALDSALGLYCSKNPGIRKGENNARWKGGISHSNGYILIHQPNYPSINRGRYIAEHRLVIEKAIGRYLTKNELVHHINGIKNDNRIENLRLLTRETHPGGHDSCLTIVRNFIIQAKNILNTKNSNTARFY